MPDLTNIITVAQLTAMLWIVLATLAGTNIIKAAWRKSPLDGERAWILNLIAYALGIGLGRLIWPPGDGIPWYVGGLVAGLLTPYAYRVLDAVLLKRIPDARSALNGDRRDGKGLPPEGMPERRK
jgi:hypothetical protein